MNIFIIRNNPFGLSAMEKLAAVLVLALLFWTLGIPTFLKTAKAGENVANLSIVMTDTAPGAASDHTVTFTTPTGLMSGNTMEVRFEAGFDTSPITENDVTLTIDDDGAGGGAANGPQTIVAGDSPAATEWGYLRSGQILRFTPHEDIVVASSSEILIEIGDTNQVINPTEGHYQIFIQGDMPDSGNTWVAILDAVTVTAAIDTTFTFTVDGVAASEALFGTASTTTRLSQANAIDFDTLQPGDTEILAHDLTVETNAMNGFMVTIVQDQPLTSGVGTHIPRFIEDANGETGTASPTFWQSPSGTLDATETYAHFGITSTDWEVNGGEWGDGAGSDDGFAKYVGNLDTPREIFGHSGPSDGEAQSRGAARIGFAIEITSLQPAGDDYTNTLTYVATPTF